MSDGLHGGTAWAAACGDELEKVEGGAVGTVVAWPYKVERVVRVAMDLGSESRPRPQRHDGGPLLAEHE